METLSLKEWKQEDFPTLPQEKVIWDNWQPTMHPPPQPPVRVQQTAERILGRGTRLQKE